MQRVDVAVVGGGPAGTAAGLAAARAGADALVVEKGVPRADRDRPGPDSTDAAGMLDYWVDIMDLDPDRIPDDVILQELDGAEFVGPNERCSLTETGIPASYPRFGFTFDRVGMDDWLRSLAEDAGVTYRVGDAVTDVETDLDGPTHTLRLSNGEDVRADHLVLADGPQRQVTNRLLDRFMPEGESITDYVATAEANHIAYQEHRRFPEDALDEDVIAFWWGWMPGETAYPWVFPNDDGIARVGLTMPIGLDIADFDRDAYRLLREDDDRIPRGGEYVRRLLEIEYGDEYDIDEDFPLVEDRGKSGGTETYAISSTRPIDSPVGANVAVAGGAMGTTSAFHEGGYHVAVRTGKIAGRLAAEDDLGRYNDAWKEAIGAEILRNVSFADVVADHEPDDWDRTFRVVNRLLEKADGDSLLALGSAAGLDGARLLATYKRRKLRYRDGKYVQVPESKYVV